MENYILTLSSTLCVFIRRNTNFRTNYCLHLKTGQAAFVGNVLMLDDQNEACAFVRYLELERTQLVAQDSETGASGCHLLPDFIIKECTSFYQSRFWSQILILCKGRKNF